ncbi:hypothetical protein WMY93_020095 [Mugilogobius chulae]|uniref:Uncharacterized protein n=1 Tax=Mugilogobius chulae TaxID=88201 RepID=A0AAW0NL06_9GOBI
MRRLWVNCSPTHAQLQIPSPCSSSGSSSAQSSAGGRSGSHPRVFTLFRFLNSPPFSFAIPPPISASVRSRQAGTETEREASAMEALGPGKRRGTKAFAKRRRALRKRRGCTKASTLP